MTMTVSDLIERVTKATEGDRELDREIMVAVFGEGTRHALPLPTYSSSVDAALGLMERKLPGATWSRGIPYAHEAPAQISLWRELRRNHHEHLAVGHAPTVPLAIILATLHAIRSSSP